MFPCSSVTFCVFCYQQKCQNLYSISVLAKLMRGLADRATQKSSESSFPLACTHEPHRTIRLKVLVSDIWQTPTQTYWSLIRTRTLPHNLYPPAHHRLTGIWLFLPHTLKNRLTFSLKTLVYTHYFYFKVTFHMTVLLEPNKHSLSNISNSSRAFIGRPQCLLLKYCVFCYNSSSY